MKATLLCAFFAVFLAASYGIGGKGGAGKMYDYDGGISEDGGIDEDEALTRLKDVAGKMYDYDGGMSEDGEMMYEYDGEMGGKMANGQGGGMSPMIANGHDEFGNSCWCRIGLWCPSGYRKTGVCKRWCTHWLCKAWVRCCRE